jgi:CheY-like chemotaxis protein/HPt (histidine-containing phosphotransfer) domain-containing protein
MTFPAVTQEEELAVQQRTLEDARAAFAGKRLLLVDDDAALRLTTRHKLQPLGVEIDQAPDGQRALEALARQQYDIVLLDLNMPLLDGYAVARSLRQGDVPLNRSVPIVAHTSEPAHIAAVKARSAGMNGFVGKPSTQEQLMQALLDALGKGLAAQVGIDKKLAGRHILVADDAAHNRKTVSAYLRHAGANVLEAAHGGAVLDELRANPNWDAVLLDINMPGMDGLETAAAIRRLTGPVAALPIVALTAHSDPKMIEAAQLAGMTAFITKPVDADVLYRTLAQLLSGAPAVPVLLRPAVIEQPVGDTILNPARLESYSRMGMLDELLGEYVPQMAALVGKLQRHAALREFDLCKDVLHSLLGMSGEAGAPALYQAVRRVYVPMVETGEWPQAVDFAGHIAALAARTEQALKAYRAAHAGANQD